MRHFLLLISLVIFAGSVSAQTAAYKEGIKKADSLAAAKDYKNAALTYSAAFKANSWKTDPAYRYNAACAWARAGFADSAFYNLNLIAGRDYFNYDHLLTDADLTSLHADKRWQVVLDKIKEAKLTVLPVAKQQQDFDILVSALKEAHTGLYWYNTPAQFDSICTAQRAKLKPGLNELDFYNIVTPLVVFVKEGHSFIHIGAQTQAYLRFNVGYFPVFFKFLNQKPYIINNIGDTRIKGMQLLKINGRSMDEIMQKFLSLEPSDGYNQTGKYRWIETGGKFSTYYARCYPPSKTFNIQVLDPETNQTKTCQVAAVNIDELRKAYIATANIIPNLASSKPAELTIDTASKTAILTFNSFSKTRYTDAGLKFHDFVDSAFKQIMAQNAKHLIIDIRKNGGGKEGYEDYLLSYLTDKDYLKYKYIQASAFGYSFYQYTDYKDDWQQLESTLKHEHYLEKDGRILRKPGIEEHQKPQANPFKGDVYILISGLTYSGGSEFASLAKNHTDAVFIGEETGGGYYGNTSGIRITLILPNSKVEVAVPLLKFVVDTPKDTNPFGHGLIPDYQIQPTIHQFLTGYDAELEYAKQLIKR